MRVTYPLGIFVHTCKHGPCLSPKRAAFGLSGLTLSLTLIRHRHSCRNLGLKSHWKFTSFVALLPDDRRVVRALHGVSSATSRRVGLPAAPNLRPEHKHICFSYFFPGPSAGSRFFFLGVARFRGGSSPLVLWSRGPLVSCPLVLWSPGPIGTV